MKNVAAVVLAAGEGTRIKARKKNKVAYKLAGKPMISYPVETLTKVGVETIVVVVKFAKESVKAALRGFRVMFAEQGEKKGTAPALESALEKIPDNIQDLIVVYGDDSAFYPPELFQFLLDDHHQHLADVTLLSIKVDNPAGLGRILRDSSGKPTGIVEEKVATEEQKQINEVNTGCYCFKLDFIKNRLGDIQINPVSSEYYLTDIVEVALRQGNKVHVCPYPDSSIWHGVNDRSQWAKARMRKLSK